MDTFGERLKSEREKNGLSVQDVAETLRVDRDQLLALERNDFGALPDEAAMIECLHGYAECLDVDADLMIEDYVQERDRYVKRRRGAGAAQAAEPAPATSPGEAEGRPRFSFLLVALGVAAIVLLGGWWMLSRDLGAPTPEVSPASAAAEPEPVSRNAPAEVAPAEAPTTESIEPEPLSTEPSDGAEPAPEEPSPARPAPEPAEPSSLIVAEHGVGAAVENRHLVGESDRFAEGTRAFFWTHVQGGARGDRIVHVWLREGTEVARISLAVGGSSWKTHSIKTLHAGLAGDWVVEARDDQGRLLARSEFACVP